MRKGYFMRVFLVLVLMSFLYSHAYANVSYTVRKGDSIYKIAKKFGVKGKSIMEANRLESNRIKPGLKLNIPVLNEKTPKSSKASAIKTKKQTVSKKENDAHIAAKNEVNRDERKNPEKTGYHIVKKGDTLSSISKQYSISVSGLRELNNLKKSSRLGIGKRLLVKRSGPRTYTVRKGDSIWKIAKKTGIGVGEIEELNGLDTDDLRPGQKLILDRWTEEEERESAEKQETVAKVADDIKRLTEPQTEAAEEVPKDMKEQLVLLAKTMLDIPYRFGGTTFMGIDCSAYVQKVFGLIGVSLPRTAREQFKLGEPVGSGELSVGDLLFFRTYAPFPSHVGIYLGGNLFIHASSKGRKVTIDSLDTPYYTRRFIGAKRLFADSSEDEG
jgi:cell wall-associated NlpC family hydrolase